jgi:hypothetical protein
MARPIYVLEAAFASSPDDPIDSQVWEDISRYLDVQAGVRITHGKTDELGDVQPSTLSATLKNSDGIFTPNRTASPYYPNVKVGKYVRLSVMWPGGGKNYATNVLTSNTLTGWTGTGTVPPTLAMSTVGPPVVGTHALQISWGVGGSVPAASLTLNGLVIGRTYTVSAQARVPSSGSGPAVLLGISGIIDGSPTTLLDTWQQIKVTFTATANSHILRVRPATSPTGGTGRVNAVQVEEGSVATAFVNTPGTFSRRFTGPSVEWPTAWDGGPAYYAETKLSAVDPLAPLTSGDRQFQTLIIEDILDDDPIACYPLTEARLSLSAGDISGNDAPPIFGTQTGVGGAIDFGQDYIAATATTTAVERVPTFYRGRATACGFAPSAANSGRYLSAYLRAPVVSATGATVIAYAREGTSPFASGTVAVLMAADGSYLAVEKDVLSGNITARFFDARTGITNQVASGIGLGSDGPAQYAAVLDIPSAGNGRVTFYWNGAAVGTPVTFAMASVPQWTIVSVGGRPHSTFKGDVSFVSFYAYPVPVGAIFAQRQSAFFGQDGTGDTSTSRIVKILGFLDQPLPIIGGSGPQGCGPQEVEGAPLDAIHLVEATEDGLLFFDGSGAPNFRLRNYRINRAPDATVAADMIDPTQIGFRGDNYGLTNDVTATRPDGAVSRVVNADSVADHGRVKDSISAVSTSDSALRILAAWQANVDGVQRNRITGIRVSLLNFPSLISSLLTLELWRKLRLTDLPTAQAPAAGVDLIVEGWSEVISEEDWSMTFTTSPGEAVDVWQIGVAGHSEIGTTTTIGY